MARQEGYSPRLTAFVMAFYVLLIVVMLLNAMRQQGLVQAPARQTRGARQRTALATAARRLRKV